MCDACSLAAEGEADIQENFCHSPYGESKNDVCSQQILLLFHEGHTMQHNIKKKNSFKNLEQNK